MHYEKYALLAATYQPKWLFGTAGSSCIMINMHFHRMHYEHIDCTWDVTGHWRHNVSSMIRYFKITRCNQRLVIHFRKLAQLANAITRHTRRISMYLQLRCLLPMRLQLTQLIENHLGQSRPAAPSKSLNFLFGG